MEEDIRNTNPGDKKENVLNVSALPMLPRIIPFTGPPSIVPANFVFTYGTNPIDAGIMICKETQKTRRSCQ
jgi:hypothetical protein